MDIHVPPKIDAVVVHSFELKVQRAKPGCEEPVHTMCGTDSLCRTDAAALVSCRFVVLLSGLVINALRTEDLRDQLSLESLSWNSLVPKSLQWLNALVWAFLLSSLVAVAATAIADIRKENMENFASKVRTKAKTMLSHQIFDVRFSNYLLLRWLAGA